MNSTVTTCSFGFCPAPVNTVTSTSMILPLPTGNHSGENVFSHSLTAWLFPGDSQCGRKFTNKPTQDVLFYEDAALNENGDAHVSWPCAGIRTNTARTMLNLSNPSGPYLQELIPVSVSIKPLGIFLLPPKWDASPSQGTPQHYLAGTHLYTWVERGTMRVKCPAQEHNTMTPARPRTQTAQSG